MKSKNEKWKMENLKQNKIEILEMKKTKMKNEKYIMKNQK